MANPIKARLGGLFLMLLGGGLSWYFILKPLQEAANHVPNISYHTKGAAFGPLLLLGGLSALIFGDSLNGFLYSGGGENKKLTPLGWIVTLAAVGIAIGVYLWMENRFKELGYG